MRKIKRFIPMLFISALALTGCTLFDDSDLAIHNHFHAPETEEEIPEGATVIESGEGKVVDEASKGNATAVENCLVFKNVGYSENKVIKNTYGNTGSNHNEFNVNGDQDYAATDTTNNYDLYVPDAASRTDDHVVILFIHGGAWISGFKTDVNSYVHEFAGKGYITATLKYTLMKQDILEDGAEEEEKTNTELSLFRNLDEIDACLKSIKSVIGQLGFNTEKSHLVIGGASSGSHLAMLYSYSRGDKSPLPISFVVNAVGPTDIKPYVWKAFIDDSASILDAGLDKNAIKAQADADNLQTLNVAIKSLDFNWNDYRTLRIANGMCGLPYSSAAIAALTDSGKTEIVHPDYDAAVGMLKSGGGEDQVSVTYWMTHTSNKYPMVCAYAGLDGVVGIAQYANLQTTLDSEGIAYKYTYFRNSKHDEISKDKDPTGYAELVGNVDGWCQKVLAGQVLN